MLSHSNLNFLDNTATIQADCPFLVCKVMFDATVWIPHVGMKLGELEAAACDTLSLTRSQLAKSTYAPPIMYHFSSTAHSMHQYPDIIYRLKDGSLSMVLRKTTQNLVSMPRLVKTHQLKREQSKQEMVAGSGYTS